MIKDIQKIKVCLNKEHIGNLALTPDNLAAFEYEKEFLASGFSISPFY